MRTVNTLSIRGVVVLLVAVPLLFGLAGCGKGSGMRSPDFSSSSSNSAMDMKMEDRSAAGLSAATNPDMPSSSPSVEQQIIVSGSMRLIVDDPVAALEEATTIVKDLKGSVSSTNVDNSLSFASAHAVLLIPSDSYDDAVAQISALGDIKEKSTDTEDVGAVIVDLDARIEVLEASIGRLTELMKNASSTSELLEAERELTNRQSDLDGLKAQRTWYTDQVQYATLAVNFRATAGADASSPSIWKESWNEFLGGIGTILYIIIMFVPWLIIIVPVVLLFLWGVKRRRARKEAQLQARMASAPMTPPVAEVPSGAQAGPAMSRPSEQPTPADASASQGKATQADTEDSEPEAPQEPEGDVDTTP